MRKVVSLSTYLSSYNLKREDFDKEIEKDRAFYDKYIDWGSKKDGSDTILPPKVLEKLGEIFNDPLENMTVTIDGVVQEKPDTEKRKDKVNMGEFMEKPTEAKEESSTEKEIKQKRTVKDNENKKPRRKKTKLNITRQFIQEHGQADVTDANALKQLRKFLMNDGNHKLEEVALMTDEEVQTAFGKNFYVIDAAEGTYIIKRSVLAGIMSDVYIVERE